jgi:iron complex transport system ATP-binding protein
LRAILGLIPHNGTSNFTSKSANEKMSLVAWVPQDRDLVWDVKVESMLGFTLEKICEVSKPEISIKRTAIKEALEITNTLKLANHNLKSLSGGELTAVLIARALVQQTPTILLDEPLASLDPMQKVTILSLLRDLSASGKTILASLHDIDIGKKYFSRYLGLKSGKIAADLPPKEAIQKRNFDRIYSK